MEVLNKSDIAVIIPIYTKDMNSYDFISLDQNIKMLRDYTIIFIKPRSLDIQDLAGRYGIHNSENFDDRYFEGIEGYNELMLSEDFYKRFEKYKYILICQTDAYIFKDELLQWGEKGYDYIGAPWTVVKSWQLTPIGFLYVKFRKLLFRLHLKNYYKEQVGNGGLSLRKTEKFIQITHKYREHFKKLLSARKKFYPEDLVLLYELEHTADRLRKPDFHEALHFSIERNPQWSYSQIGGTMPFGCHAWYKSKYYKFYKPIITPSMSDNELNYANCYSNTCIQTRISVGNA